MDHNFYIFKKFIPYLLLKYMNEMMTKKKDGNEVINKNTKWEKINDTKEWKFTEANTRKKIYYILNRQNILCKSNTVRRD